MKYWSSDTLHTEFEKIRDENIKNAAQMYSVLKFTNTDLSLLVVSIERMIYPKIVFK